MERKQYSPKIEKNFSNEKNKKIQPPQKGPPRRQVLHPGRHVVLRLPRLRARDGGPALRPSRGEGLRARRRPPRAGLGAVRPRAEASVVGRQAREGVFHADRGAKADQEAAVLAAGRGAEGEVRLLQGRGEKRVFFFFFTFLCSFFFTFWRRKRKENKLFCYDDQIKSLNACYTVDSPFYLSFEVEGGDEPEK